MKPSSKRGMFRARFCSECGHLYAPKTTNQSTCSSACNVARAQRRNRKKQLPAYRVAKRRSHPYVAAADSLEAVLRATPPKRQAQVEQDALRRLAAQEGERFAEMIRFALAERRRGA
jgi:hypothetical protein